MNEDQDIETNTLNASNFNLPEGVDFYIDYLAPSSGEIGVVISIESDDRECLIAGVVHLDGDEIALDMPIVWEICGECRGEGKRLADGFHGVAFTEEDRRDWSPEDTDDYFGGALDVGCPECEGTGKIRALDLNAVPFPLSKAIRDWSLEEEADAAERAQERAMGC